MARKKNDKISAEANFSHDRLRKKKKNQTTGLEEYKNYKHHRSHSKRKQNSVPLFFISHFCLFLPHSLRIFWFQYVNAWVVVRLPHLPRKKQIFSVAFFPCPLVLLVASHLRALWMFCNRRIYSFGVSMSVQQNWDKYFCVCVEYFSHIIFQGTTGDEKWIDAMSDLMAS